MQQFCLQDEEIQEQMDQMRSKFKTTVVLLGLQQEYSLSGQAVGGNAPDTSF